MEIPDYNFFIDREKGKPCLVAGSAPTLKNFPFRRFKGIYFLMNSGPLLLKGLAQPSYWLCANPMYPVPTIHYKDINQFKDCVYIFSDTAVYGRKEDPRGRLLAKVLYKRGILKYDRDKINEKIKIPWFAFDIKHLGHQRCSPPEPCCRFLELYPHRPTIFEVVRDHFHEETCFPCPNTAVVFSLAFAILTGCSPIYLQGIELPQNLKHYSQFNPMHRHTFYNFYLMLRGHIGELFSGKPLSSGLDVNYDETIQAFRYLVRICHKMGIEIYNLSQTSALTQIQELPYFDHRKI